MWKGLESIASKIGTQKQLRTLKINAKGEKLPRSIFFFAIYLQIYSFQSMDREHKPPKGKVADFYEPGFHPDQLGPRFEKIKFKTKGSYGSVYWGKDKKTKNKVAIKRVPINFEKIDQTRRKLREIVLLKNSNHPNIVQLKQICIPMDQTLQNFDHIFLITEYCETDLHELRKRKEIFESQHIKYMIYQILCGLNYLHSASILHRDLKPSNILINPKSFQVKICDLGLARVMPETEKNQEMQEQNQDYEFEEEQSEGGLSPNISRNENNSFEQNCKTIEKFVENSPQTKKRKLSRSGTLTSSQSEKMKFSNKMTQRVTTRWYRAPQVILLHNHYNKPIDMWSFGCIYGELLTYDEKINPNISERGQVLFPGDSCYPVSPKQFETGNDYDQLSIIFSRIGKPEEKDIEFLKDQKAKQYVRGLKVKTEEPLKKLFSVVDPQGMKLLLGCLKFNPSQRLTVTEALKLDYFNGIRNEENEFIHKNFNYTVDETINTVQELRSEFKKFIAK